MILKVYCVLDAKAGYFGQPLFAQSEGAAVRSFSDAVNNEKSGDWFRHPEDFQLFEIGEYDDATGEIVGKVPKVILSAMSVRIPDLVPESKLNGSIKTPAVH